MTRAAMVDLKDTSALMITVSDSISINDDPNDFSEMYKGEGNSELGWWNDVSCDKPASGYICSYDSCKFSHKCVFPVLEIIEL